MPIPSQYKSVSRIDTVHHRLVFGADKLTVACVSGAQLAMCKGFTSVHWLEGLIPVTQDWHTQVILTFQFFTILVGEITLMKLFTSSANTTMIYHHNRQSNCCIANLLIPKGLGEGIFLLT